MAGLERQNILLQNALDVEQLLGQVALDHVGAYGTIEDRLEVQLDLTERTYQLKRRALLEDVKLTDTQLQNELLKLDLANEREQLQLRMTAEAEKERGAADRKASIGHDLLRIGTGVTGDLLSGRGVDGSALGSSLGSLAANFVPIPGAGMILPVLGGVLAGLFGKKKEEKPPEQPIVKGLEAIERAQRETITTIQAQTDALLNPENRLLNLPSNFNVPS